MPSEKACKHCKLIVQKGDKCPLCGSTELTTSWKGYVIIFNPEVSEIAKKMGINAPGKYALRIGK
ncbi:MAG: DNA-directed RNA polymerase, subunit E'' [Candidatus Diapherotrites archaeon]|nr:DNA-directed RNA polymerase, subunit E'' [Candidatus Diapherotrites archaeon]